MGGALPSILTDGLHQGLAVEDPVPVLSLGLTEVGQPLTQANPSMLDPVIAGETKVLKKVELPEGMEARLK